MVFQLPILGLEVSCCAGYFLSLVAIWWILGTFYPLLGFFRSLLPRSRLAQKYGPGSWAVVTGASRGIGQEFCQALAREGLNIALVARSDTQKFAEDLGTRYKVKTRVVKCDLRGHGKNLREFYEGVWAQMEDLDVSIVVNNAGVAFDGLYSSHSPSDLQQLLEVNVWPIVLFSRWALTKMVGRKNKSALINVASICALCPYAGFGMYCATKKFDDFLSISLANEVKVDPMLNVDVLSLRPSYVNTGLLSGLKVQPEMRARASTTACVQGALNSLGREKYTAGATDHKIETLQMRRNTELDESKGYLTALLSTHS